MNGVAGNRQGEKRRRKEEASHPNFSFVQNRGTKLKKREIVAAIY